MKLGEFIKNFSHNNLIRLWYKCKGGHELVEENVNDLSMDWEVNKQEGRFRHYVNNEVLELASISFHESCRHPEALNIVIEKLENQPFLEDKYEERTKGCDTSAC
jgi:hypothetical protein